MNRYNLKIDYIVDKYASLVMKNENIIGMGRGRKNIGGIASDIPTVTFFVKEKVSKDMLSQSNVLPPSIGGVITDVFEVGEIKQRAAERIRPARAGMSIGVKVNDRVRSGTIGYAVSDKNVKKNIYILTSNHALTRFGAPFKEEVKVYQPSLESGGNIAKDEIGVVHKIIPLKTGIPIDGTKYNEVDAALINVGPNSQDTVNEKLVARLYDNNFIKGITDASEDGLHGKAVLMQGAASGRIAGTIFSERSIFKFTNNISSSVTEYIMYRNQVLCKIDNNYGDSGALGYTHEGTKAFGLFWGGSDKSQDGKLGIFSPIKRVLELLNVDLLI